jgi:hypothetical protein
LKLGILLTAVTLFTSHAAFAECNTVMGGCVKEEVVNVAPHMRSDGNKPVSNTKPATAPANKNIKNIDANSNQAAKPATATKKI